MKTKIIVECEIIIDSDFEIKYLNRITKDMFTTGPVWCSNGNNSLSFKYGKVKIKGA